MKVTIFKNTNFGNNDLVWNVPHPDYDFSQHEIQTFENVNMRFPLLTTGIVVNGDYDFNTAFYDYMTIEDDNGVETFYFINTIVAERKSLIFSVMLDAITTYGVLELPISGTIVRKHDTNLDENRFDYPTALTLEGNFTNSIYDTLSYGTQMTRFIESAVDLKNVSPSITIDSLDGGSITVPQLPKPEHNTDYEIVSWSGYIAKDIKSAFTLYDADLISMDVLNTVRGLSGDGAISDSYAIPSDAVDVYKVGSQITRVRAKFIRLTSNITLDTQVDGYVPKNEAIKGIFSISIMSLQEKTKITFPAWDLKNSTDESGFIKFTLWCDPKPSGAPYCSPAEVHSLHPLEGTDNSMNAIATLESKSVRGGQWLRNPLIYSTGKGEIFSTMETRLQRERADYEKSVSFHQLELTKRERDIQIAQQDYNYQSGLASSIIGGGISLLTKDFGGAFSQAKSAFDGTVNRGFVEQMRDLQSYQMQAEKQLINMAHSNNLKNLNVQERIRRVVPSEVVFEPNESMGTYEQYNSFMIIKEIPDIESLKALDMEFSKYGYPVFESVNNFKMLEHLRQNHTVYQFVSPTLEIGGQIGDMARTLLESGIRILSKPYTINNIINNPKRI